MILNHGLTLRCKVEDVEKTFHLKASTSNFPGCRAVVAYALGLKIRLRLRV